MLYRPWLLAPAAAVFMLVLAANMVIHRSGQPPLPALVPAASASTGSL